MSEERSQRRSVRSVLRSTLRAPKLTAERRRMLMRVGAISAALALLVAAPAYIAMQPKFFLRYANLDSHYQTWSESVHAEVACQNCHVGPKLAARAAYALRMAGEFYLTIPSSSRTPRLQETPVNEACNDCHIDLRTVSPAGDVKIPHKAHVEILQIQCVRCHRYLVHSKNAKGTHSPAMADCLECHDGVTAKKECPTCHTEKAQPEYHRAKEWVVIHSQKKDEIDCQKCHGWTDNWCSACHSRRPKSHGADWRAQHRNKVGTHRNCEVCHRASFCVRCHGEVPKLNFNPALRIVK